MRQRVAFKNTLALFDMYWVEGMSTTQIADEVGDTTTATKNKCKQRGIPLRTPVDRQRYQEGNAPLRDLQWHYLSPFQRSLVYELEKDRVMDL